MDIDDILVDIDRESLPRETLDLQELTRAWVAERVAPELLPYPDALMERVSARIRKQVRSGTVFEIDRILLFRLAHLSTWDVNP